jgi:hypothetical protein
MINRLLVGFVVVLALGCGGGSKGVVPVSGKVTLDGKPLPNATVMFSPIADPGSIDAGPGSSAKTNEKGEYTLQASTGKKGAQVGKHRVTISSLSPQITEGDERPRGGPPLVDKIPAKYRDMTREVPAGGTDQMNFELTSK